MLIHSLFFVLSDPGVQFQFPEDFSDAVDIFKIYNDVNLDYNNMFYQSTVLKNCHNRKLLIDV